MKKLVFGLGLSQVVLTILAALAGNALLAWVFALAGKRGIGLDWQSAIALGSALAMSSTAIVVKLMADRLELESEHGRRVMGVLLFQDLAVVPLLVLIPALGSSPEALLGALAIALVKAGGAAGGAAGRRQVGDALVADAGGAPEERGAVRPQPAAGHARPGLAHRAGGALARARRLRRRHADRRDRVQAPGRDRHPAVPRRPARPVLHHRRHEAGCRVGAAALADRAGDDRVPGALQVRPRHRAGAALRRRAGHRDPHRPLPGAGGRVRLRPAGAGDRAQPACRRRCRARCWRAWCSRCC